VAGMAAEAGERTFLDLQEHAVAFGTRIKQLKGCAALKRPASAVRFGPWPPLSIDLSNGRTVDFPATFLNKEPRYVPNPTMCRCLPRCLQYRES
jgi:hypothetical protein